MALKDLSIEAMISVSERILNPPANRPQVHNKDELYSGLLVLKRAHEHLVSLNRRDGEVRELSAKFTEELAELDREHDRCSRAICRTLESAIDITLDPKTVDEFRAAISELFPNGLTINQLSYNEQAGNTFRVVERVTPELRLLLSTMNIAGQSFDAVLDRWLLAGKTMGERQAERDTLNTDDDPDRVTAALIVDGRNQWIRAANAFIAALSSTDFTDAERTMILAHLRATELQAAGRRKKSDDAPNQATETAETTQDIRASEEVAEA